MNLLWSPGALRDLKQVGVYIASDSPFYARQFTERLIMAAERLQDFPLMGRSVPEAVGQNHIREIIFQGYRIIYRFEAKDAVEIVAVLHGARNLADMSPPWKK